MKYCLDIGCGKNKRDGFIGIDQYPIEGVDAVCDLSVAQWWFDREIVPGSKKQLLEEGVPRYMLPDNCIDEVYCSHFLEHLTALQRVLFMNELFRVLKPSSQARIITPHWASNRAYGDFTHQWPPVSEMYYYYLSADWRASEVPHTDMRWNKLGFSCNFQATWEYLIRQDLAGQSRESQIFAIQNYKEVVLDLCATITKL